MTRRICKRVLGAAGLVLGIAAILAAIYSQTSAHLLPRALDTGKIRGSFQSESQRYSLSRSGLICNAETCFHIAPTTGGEDRICVGGSWGGLLPPAGSTVEVESPTGLVGDVRITETETGAVYISATTGNQPVQKGFLYRVSDDETGQILCEGSARSHDSFGVLKVTKTQCGKLGELSREGDYVVQIWESGEIPPPPVEPRE